MVEAAVTGNGEVTDDLELLRERLAELCTEREKLERKNSSLAAENAWLQQRVRDLIARLYGRRHSEKFPPGQEPPSLFELPDAAARLIKEAAASLASTAPTPQRRPGKHGRKRLPENLPRVREEVLPEPEARLCKCCGKEMDRIGEEVTANERALRETLRGAPSKRALAKARRDAIRRALVARGFLRVRRRPITLRELARKAANIT